MKVRASLGSRHLARIRNGFSNAPQLRRAETVANTRRQNNGLQLTRSARCAPFAFRSRGQSLRAALAAEAEC